MLRRLASLACVLMSMALAAGASAAEVLNLWHGYRGAERAAFEQLIDDYNRSQSGIEVKALAVPFGGYADKLSAALPRGQGPDIFVFAHDRLGGWASAGHTVAPIDRYISERLLRRFTPNLIDAMTFGGDLYGLPLAFKSPALILNTDLVQTAYFASKGLAGVLYWYSLYPIHGLIFSRMIDLIARRAVDYSRKAVRVAG